MENVNKALNNAGIVFGGIPQIPTQEAIDGIRFDFNDGLRVVIPKDAKPYRIQFYDIDSESLIYETTTPQGGGCTVSSHKKYFIRFRLRILEPANKSVLFTHDFDAKDKEVTVRFPVHTLGDSIGWFSYVERFQEKLKCKLNCVVSECFSEVVKKQYPTINFATSENVEKIQSYANYNIGLWEIGNVTHQPVDHRYVGLHRLAAYILGVDDTDIPPRFDLSSPRIIQEKYVCIGIQSTSLAKFWNNPHGWDKVVNFLKENGFRVLCIDKESCCEKPGSYVRIPFGAEDFTGDKPLQERINILKDASFFIGLSSGLSWLAWGCGIPVVMISGFTNPLNEFKNPYRVINYNACNSCWNDLKDFDLADFWCCPRLAGTEHRFECTAMISAEYVIKTIERLMNDKGIEL